MKIAGQTIIFKNDYGYSTSISKKNENGTYENMSVVVQLPKDTELENKTKINITKGFITFYKTKDGLPKVKFVVQEFEPPFKEQDEDIIIDEFYSDSDLPF